MKSIFLKFSTAFAVIAALIMCSIFASASPPPIQTQMENRSAKVLIVGSPGVGLTAIIAAKLAERSIEAVFVADYDSGGGLTVNRDDAPIIVNKSGVVPITTAGRDDSINRRKTETRESVSKFTGRIFYDLPPNNYGYSGISFANLTRAEPKDFKTEIEI